MNSGVFSSSFDVTARDGVVLRVHSCGPVGAPTVLCVHGFPDDHTAWEPIASLLSSGLRVVAFDVRGSGRSGRPSRLSSYRLDQLADDVAAVADAVAGDERVHLVGHDWGSVQVWHAVTRVGASRRYASATSISGGCLDHLPSWIRNQARSGAAGRKAVASMWKSPFYMGFLQTPVIGDLACRVGVVDRIIGWTRRFEGGTTPRGFSADRARRHRHGLKIYTANLLPRLLRPRPLGTSVPVQALAPRRDVFITPPTAHVGREWATEFTVHSVEGGHWAAAFCPGPVAAHISEFVAQHEKAPQEQRKAHP